MLLVRPIPSVCASRHSSVQLQSVRPSRHLSVQLSSVRSSRHLSVQNLQEIEKLMATTVVNTERKFKAQLLIVIIVLRF